MTFGGGIGTALDDDRAGLSFVAFLLVAALLVPVLNLLVPASSPFHVSTYVMTLIGKYMCYAMLALAVDFIWGFCGILSLGHAAFFALGGYAMGMYLMRQIGTRGVYGNPLLPDFMVFLNWTELPWFWPGFGHFWWAMAMVVVVPGLLALVFGWLAFRSRVTGVYLSIITQALSYALMLAFFRNDMGFGGNNGFATTARSGGWVRPHGQGCRVPTDKGLVSAKDTVSDVKGKATGWCVRRRPAHQRTSVTTCALSSAPTAADMIPLWAAPAAEPEDLRCATGGHGSSALSTTTRRPRRRRRGRRREELASLGEVSSVPLQQTLRHLQVAFTQLLPASCAQYARFKSRKKIP